MTTKLTLISAPAGYGKTTLICQWLGQTGHKIGWLSLDEMDNNLNRFFLYFISSIQQIHPGFGESVTGVLSDSISQPGDINILPLLINELEAYSTKTILILDDYHVIRNEAINEQIDYFLSFLPEHVHLYIISRIAPPLPLPRLRACGDLNEISVTDLKFSSEELDCLMRQTMGITLSEENLRILNEKIEGWAVGLIMAAEMIRKTNDVNALINNLTGNLYYIFEYLEQEVFSVQPDGIQDFLLKTAILSRMTPALCDALTGSGDSYQVLTALKRENVFICTLDDEHRWYRYHHFFSDQLEALLIMKYPEIVDHLHKKAGKWYYENGFIEDAVSHAIKGKEFDFAAEILENEIEKIQRDCEASLSVQFVDMIPEHILLSKEAICIYKSFKLLLNGKYQLSRHCIRQVESIFRERTQNTSNLDTEADKDIFGQILVMKSWFENIKNRAESSNMLLHRALKHLKSDNRLYRILAYGNMLLSSIYLGRLDDAEEALRETNRILAQVKNISIDFLIVFNSVELLLIRGNLKRAQIKLEKENVRLNATYPELSSRFPGFGLIYMLSGTIFLEMNEVDKAEENLKTGIDLLRHFNIVPNVLMYGYIRLAEVFLLKGDEDRARKTLHHALTLELSYQYPLPIDPYAFIAKMDILANDLIKGASWINQNQLSIDDDIILVNEPNYIVLARYFLKAGNYDNALSVLMRLLDLSNKEKRFRSTLEILILLAITHHKKGNSLEAKKYMSRALTIADPEGYSFVFLFEGLAIADVFELLKQDWKGKDKDPLFVYMDNILQ
ncbi:MAG: hypothetical protein ACFFH0_13100, partial [Promethearchaeota archaeon]